MTEMFAGVDVHSKKTFWVIQNEQGQVVAETECATTREGLMGVIEQHRLPEATRVGLESGPQARWIVHVLSGAGLRAEVLSPQEIRAKAFRRGRKSDRRDAFEICDGLRRDQFVARVWTPTAQICRLRRTLSRRRHFISIRTAQINAVKGLLKTECDAAIPTFLNSVKAWDRLAHRYEDSELAFSIDLHREVWTLVRAHTQALEAQLDEELRPFAQTMTLLSGAPCVGPITASTFIAVVGDPNRFADSGHLASYLGLTPSIYDSGESERHGSITKQGSTALRTALCEAAQQARRPTNPLNPYFLRVKARGGYKKAIVAVAHRLARILYQMWKRDEPFDWHRLNVRYEPKHNAWTSYYHIGKAA